MDQNTQIFVTRVISDKEIFLVATGWTMIFLMLMLVLTTYFMGYKQSEPKAKSLLALALFFCATEIHVLYNAVITWSYLADRTIILPKWTQVRVWILFLATSFVFYTAWHRKKPIKIVEVDSAQYPKNRIGDL